MFSMSFSCFVLAILVCYAHGQASNDHESNTFNRNENEDSVNIDNPSIPVHNDTSHDNDGADTDTEPLQGNGRGSHEANSQNYAAENKATHGMAIEDFQQIILDQHNIYRRHMCANDLETDEDLHRIAEERAHSEANGQKLPLPDDYNENVYENDTGDPSIITEMIVKSWFDQRQQYDINRESSATDFSQLKLYVIVVYKPSGNIRGEFAANVGCNSNGPTSQGTR